MGKKLGSVTAAGIVAALGRLGFVRVSQKGSHLKLRHPDGRTAIIPMHRRDMPAGTLRSILRQAGVTPDELAAVL
jgi:predicted RNA binding protein YcfA (HicA-like mRNA interferase family)